MSEQETLIRRICFVGSVRCANPLNVTDEKKFRALRSLGEIFIIGFSGQAMPRCFTQFAHFYLLPELPLAVLRYIELFTLAPLLIAWLILRYRIQLCIAQSPYEAVPAAMVKMVAGWFGYRLSLAIESHGDFEQDLFLQRKIFFPRLFRAIMRNAARFAFDRADVLRAISQSTRTQLERWKPGVPIVQFMAWTDIEAFLSAGKARDEIFQPVFLYSGVMIPRKGVLHLINAFASISKKHGEARLILLGKAQDQAYVEHLTARIHDLGIEQRVQFVPPVSQQELAQWMAQAGVFVLPSISEGLGRVVIEAMAAGTPVIGSRAGGIPDMIQDGFTGFLVTPGDEIALAEKMNRMLAHPAETRQMGQQARIFAQQFFSEEIYLRGYVEIAAEAEKRQRSEQ